MKKQTPEAPADVSPRRWLYLSAIAILVVGLACAALVYKSAADYSNRVQEYRGGGVEGLPSPDNSKQYLRDLELYGGAANVLAYKFRAWFAGLWQGESLAYTIIFITLLVSSGIFYVAGRLPPGAGADRLQEGPGGKGGKQER